MGNKRQDWFHMMVLFLALLAVCFGQPAYKRPSEISTQAFQSLIQIILAILER